MDGQGFQFTPMGVLPLGAVTGGVSKKMAPAVVRPQPSSAQAPQQLTLPAMPQAPVFATPSTVATSSALITPRDVVKAARARVREIRAELKHHKRLQSELAELERMLAAARSKPKAVVTTIRRTG